MKKHRDQSLDFKSVIYGSIIAVGTMFFNPAIGCGILLGLLFAVIRMFLLVRYIDTILGIKAFNLWYFILNYLGSFGMLAIPLYIGSVYPNFVNVFGVAFGLVFLKLMIYLNSFLSRRKER